MFDVSTSSCAHLTVILSFSSICLCHSSLLLLIPFPPSSLLIPSAQVALGLPRFLLPGGLHFITFLVVSPIFQHTNWICQQCIICPYHNLSSFYLLLPSLLSSFPGQLGCTNYSLTYFYSKTNQMYQCIKFILFGMTIYMFRTVFLSIIRSSRLYIQQPNRYCCLLASRYPLASR